MRSIFDLLWSKVLKAIEDKTAFVTVKHLSAKELNKLELDIPCIEEQNLRADSLSKLEKIISLHEEELRLLDNLIKARFVEMFGDPVHSEKYGTRTLSSCVADKSDMVDGPWASQVNTKVDYIENGEIPVIRTVNVKMMSFSPIDLKYMKREKYETVIRSRITR